MTPTDRDALIERATAAAKIGESALPDRIWVEGNHTWWPFETMEKETEPYVRANLAQSPSPARVKGLIDALEEVREHITWGGSGWAKVWAALDSLASPSPAQWPEDVVERARRSYDEHECPPDQSSCRTNPKECACMRAALATLPPPETFQARVAPWMAECFGPEISADKVERNDRFIEEALELVQASGYTAERAHAMVDYTFNRPQGEINQEVGGVMVTLAAHCLAHGVDMHEAAETELARIWTKVEQIRAKQAAKPKHSPLPIPKGPEIENRRLQARIDDYVAQEDGRRSRSAHRGGA